MSVLLPATVRALFRHPVIFWAVILAALAAAGAASLLVEPLWRVRAAIAVPPSAVDPVALLTNNELHRQAVQRLGAATLFPALDPPAAAQALGQALSVRRGQGNRIDLTLDGTDPSIAARALEGILAVFGEQRTHILAEAQAKALAEQIGAAHRAADEARQRFETFRQANKLWSIDDERSQLEHQHTELDGELKRITATQSDLAAKIGAYKAQLDQTPPTLDPPEQTDHYKVVDDAKARLLELQLKEQELLAKYTPTSQFVLTVRDEIARVRAFLNEMTASINRHNKPVANDAYVDLSKSLAHVQSQMAGLQERRTAVESQLTEVNRRLDEVNGHSEELRALERAKTDSEDKLHRIEAARLAQNAEPNQAYTITVIERPGVPSRPLRPQPRLYFIIALPLGVLAGLGGALLAEAMSDTFATPGDIERRLGVPVLAALPPRP